MPDTYCSICGRNLGQNPESPVCASCLAALPPAVEPEPTQAVEAQTEVVPVVEHVSEPTA